MTISIDEAIKGIQTTIKEHGIAMSKSQIAGCNLGIEALKVILKERRDLVSYAGELLPGETEGINRKEPIAK